LLDIFSYEIPLNVKKNKNIQNLQPLTSSSSKVLIYNFQSLLNHTKTLIFSLNLKVAESLTRTKSIAELFPNANWLEREVAELFNFIFEGKKDMRNLMLQYGDNTAPFQKFFPSIGLKECLTAAVYVL
jgi:NADH:ubiquinone oxidoreductase subunit C